MSEPDYGQPRLGDIRIDTSFSRSASTTRDFLGEPMPRDRHSRTSHASRVRDVTWISASQPSQYPATQTPQTPHWQHSTPIMRPALHTAQPTLSDSDYEYMTVGIDDTGADEENGYGSSEGHERKPQGRKKFYGGFMNGLKSLPRVMSRGRLNSKDHAKPAKQGATIPPYQPNPQAPGHSLMHRQVLANNVPQVERVDTPPSDVLSPARPNILLDTDTRASIADTRRDRTLSAVNELYEPSRSHSHDEIFPPHFHRDHDTLNTSHAFRHSTDAISALHTFDRSAEASSLPPTIHLSTQATATPVLVEPRPADDFAKMESPIRPPPEESIASQMARVRRFMRDLSGLPWTSPARISDEYVPGQGNRRRHSRQRYSKTSKSWYTPRNKGTLDLLSGPSTPLSTGRIPHHIQNLPAPAPRPYVINPSSTSLMISRQLRGERSRSPSSDGVPSSDSTSNAAPLYSGPLYPAYVAQPLFVYPSGLPSPGSGLETQPRPVFFTAPVSPPFASPERSRSPLRRNGTPRTPVL
ncbi:hypothetical protein CY34DRAFT_15752 [Suillus luteus UH-Slu-Lm8-n1]|uniref:Uncharacterized protein n=1 Tax=Suillus luteus UH-Slu-Lm8-n1 TaxID=930992 RepID=A0A0C9ZIW7_9AGAM|nr:hypothetical protein CY34DRAFT_15752 [Suillus luteus UH-Slu-Lm8-n1]